MLKNALRTALPSIFRQQCLILQDFAYTVSKQFLGLYPRILAAGGEGRPLPYSPATERPRCLDPDTNSPSVRQRSIVPVLRNGHCWYQRSNYKGEGLRSPSQCQCQCVNLYSASPANPPMRWVRLYRANRNVFSRRLKAASVEFGLRTGSRRLFQADGPTMAKARGRPYVLSR